MQKVKGIWEKGMYITFRGVYGIIASFKVNYSCHVTCSLNFTVHFLSVFIVIPGFFLKHIKTI
jgi:hypothetical protein